jgi:hypothetical protein
MPIIQYDANNPSGSAYYDLDILKTPVFEAFTNNASNMQSKLISISRTNLLYLPVIKKSTRMYSDSNVSGLFLVTSDTDTTKAIRDSEINNDGIIYGDGSTSDKNQHIRLDQGLDNSSEGPSPSSVIDAGWTIDLALFYRETMSRQTFLLSMTIALLAISSLRVSLAMVSLKTWTPTMLMATMMLTQAYLDPVKAKASIDLSSTTFLFDRLGSTMTLPTGTGGSDETYLTIDTVLKVTGATTGYKIDVPIRYIKKQ